MTGRTVLLACLALAVLSCQPGHRTDPSPQAPIVVDLAWQPPADTSQVRGYEVYRRPTLQAAEQLACTAPKGTHTCTDTAADVGTHYYAAYSVGGGTRSPASNVVSVVIEAEPAPVAGVPQQLRVIKVTIQGPPPPP